MTQNVEFLFLLQTKKNKDNKNTKKCVWKKRNKEEDEQIDRKIPVQFLGFYTGLHQWKKVLLAEYRGVPFLVVSEKQMFIISNIIHVQNVKVNNPDIPQKKKNSHVYFIFWCTFNHCHGFFMILVAFYKNHFYPSKFNY